MTAPLSHLTARLFGSSAELRKSTGTALSIAALQCGFLGISWLLIGWGRRSLDWSVFAASTLSTMLVSKVGHEIPLWKGLVHVLVQAAACLLVMFLIAFTAAEFGWTSF